MGDSDTPHGQRHGVPINHAMAAIHGLRSITTMASAMERRVFCLMKRAMETASDHHGAGRMRPMASSMAASASLHGTSHGRQAGMCWPVHDRSRRSALGIGDGALERTTDWRWVETHPPRLSVSDRWHVRYRDIPTIVSAADLRMRDVDHEVAAAVRNGRARYVGAIDQGDAERLLAIRLSTSRFATDPAQRRPIRRA